MVAMRSVKTRLVFSIGSVIALAAWSPRTTAAPQSAGDGSPDGAVAIAPVDSSAADGGAPATATAKTTPKKETTPADVTAWLKTKLPKNGSVDGEPAKITH